MVMKFNFQMEVIKMKIQIIIEADFNEEELQKLKDEKLD